MKVENVILQIFSNGRRVQKRKFTDDYERVNVFVKRRLQAFSPHQLYAKQKLYNRLGNMQMKNKMTPLSYKIVSPKYKSPTIEELPKFSSSPDKFLSNKSKIFMLKPQNRRFWSPGIEGNHFRSTRNKAIDTIDRMLKSYG